VRSALLEHVLRDFRQKGISIPYPQREVHVYHHGGDRAGTEAAVAAAQD
jgi:small-conductance mechanosensitive channel